MKNKSQYLAFLLFAISTFAFIAGCKYDIAEPMWDRPYTAPATPKINSVNPASIAKAGDNYIRIYGENLVQGDDSTDVYFGGNKVDVLYMSKDSLVIRRPGLVLDTCTINVAPRKALVEAKYGPYQITKVIDRYGNFLENQALNTLLADNAENLYVFTLSKTLYKCTPTGQKDSLTSALRTVTDALLGPDGNIYYFGDSRIIDRINLITNTTARWTQLPAVSGFNRAVKCGDIAANGYMYVGGNKTDLLGVNFNTPATIKPAGIYTAATDDIVSIRVHNGYVYVASRTTIGPVKIARHIINADGTVGVEELILDLNDFPDYATALVTSINFDINGTMYLSLDDQNSLLIIDQATNKPDVFYKGLIRPYCKKAVYGKQNFMYLITGDGAKGEEWTIYRVDMGANGGN